MHKRNIVGKIITNDVEVDEQNINLNTPIIISFQQKEFKISVYNFINQFECTWKCVLKRKRTRENKNKYFCDATTKGKRNEKILNKFEFFLKKQHSDLCLNYYKTLLNTNVNKIDNKNLEDNSETSVLDLKKNYSIKNNFEQNTEKDSKNKIYSILEFEDILKNYIP